MRPSSPLLLLVLLLAALGVRAIDFGPTYGQDYAGQDYNVTNWNSPVSMSANHWEAAMKLCEQYCLNDDNCITWTYCTPEAGRSDPERCCLKNGIPAEIPASTHWTGAAPRAKNFTDHLLPKIHYSATCVRIGGWHDIAASITIGGTHHAFQGCPASGGWGHALSTDLVHWTDMGIHVSAIHETNAGFDSFDSPCSGFMAVDDQGRACAGFRQCSSSRGLSHPWDVPLELRCATNENLTAFTDPIFIYPFYFNRALPYDPVRPWKAADGMWYSTIATDACNKSSIPCYDGSALHLFRSPTLQGNPWSYVGVMFATNNTVLNHGPSGGNRYNEFVTPNFIGGLVNDPAGGATRVLTDNGYGGYTMYFIGKQSADETTFSVDFTKNNTVGAIDWSSFTVKSTGSGLDALQDSLGMMYGMARTLGGADNQVTTPNQRHVIHAWLNIGARTSMTIGRDLSLDAQGSLLQMFVPELSVLRTAHTALNLQTHHDHHRVNPTNKKEEGEEQEEKVQGQWFVSPKTQTTVATGQQLEITVKFHLPLSSTGTGSGAGAGAGTPVPFGIVVFEANDGSEFSLIGVDVARSLVFVDGTKQKDGAVRAGPLEWNAEQQAKGEAGSVVWLHAVIDHGIMTVIVNNRTAVSGYAQPKDAMSGGVSLFGVGDVLAELNVWELQDANNMV